MPDRDDQSAEYKLETLALITSQQAAIMRKMSDQLRVLFAVNTVLVGALRGQVDIERVRARTLEAFTDQEADGDVITLINAMLGPVSVAAVPPSESMLRDQIKDVMRARWTVIKGG
ncbi:hypothetical protein ACLBYG_28895 [Methylobacterium sp. D53M]|jgi:hypothetical protein